LDFRTRPESVVTHNDLNVTGIRNLMQRKGQAPIGVVHAEALGVTFATPVFAMEAKTRVERTPDGTCVYLVSMRAIFGYRDLDVYVASEYPPGSCEYRAILDHENQHVAINRQGLHTHAPRVRLALEAALAEERPIQAQDADKATRQILDRVQRRADEALAAFHRELDERNGAIDTSSNYEAVAGICKDWNRGNVWPQQKH
jgi:hypothetical protein